MPSYLLTEVLTSGASTTLASIHHVCGGLPLPPSPEVWSCEGHMAKASWCVRHPVCVLAPVPLPSYFLLPPPSQGKCVCVCVSLPAKFMFTPCAGSAPANLSGKSLPATRRMKSSRGAPNQKEIIFACQSTQFSTRRNRKSYTKKPTTVEIP